MSAGAALLAAAAMAMPGHGTPPPTTAPTVVAIPGRYYSPGHLHVLVGQTVTWRNDDLVTHTVTAEEHGFDSGSLHSGQAYTHTFDTPGTYRYLCTIHRQMRGTIEVAALGLTGPDAPLAPGAQATLEALVPAGAGPVTLERLTPAGAEPVAQAAPDAAGHASFQVTAEAPARYRARAGELTSAVVAVAVAPQITATAARHGRRIRIRATIAPAVPGATVELQRYVRERFDYLPVRTTRSAGGRRVAFTLRTRRRVALRVAVTRAPGGWAATRSRLLVVRAARP